MRHVPSKRGKTKVGKGGSIEFYANPAPARANNREVDNDPEFIEYMAKFHGTGQVSKSIASHDAPTSLAELDHDPEFQRFKAGLVARSGQRRF